MHGKTTVVGFLVLAVVHGFPVLLSQTKPAQDVRPVGIELPVTLRKSVTAGNTPVGTKVEATLSIATLLKGVVVPRGAVFSGEVTTSVAKSKTGASRLGVCTDLVHWKNGSLKVKTCLTAWYYPMAAALASDSADRGPPVDNPRTWNGPGSHPGVGIPPAQPFPPHDSRLDPGATPSAPASVIAAHRVVMTGVDSTINGDGEVTIASTRFNIKLDTRTTYVLATGDLKAGGRP
jgi:hypothetical protein